MLKLFLVEGMAIGYKAVLVGAYAVGRLLRHEPFDLCGAFWLVDHAKAEMLTTPHWA